MIQKPDIAKYKNTAQAKPWYDAKKVGPIHDFGGLSWKVDYCDLLQIFRECNKSYLASQNVAGLMQNTAYLRLARYLQGS